MALAVAVANATSLKVSARMLPNRAHAWTSILILQFRLLVVRIIIRAVLQWKRVRVDVRAPNQGVAVVPDQTFSAAEVRPELRLPDLVAKGPRVDAALAGAAAMARLLVAQLAATRGAG